MEQYCGNLDMLDDVKESKQLAQIKRIVEEKVIDPDYEHVLRFILGRSNLHEQHRTPNYNNGDNSNARVQASDYPNFLGQPKKLDTNTASFQIKREGVNASKCSIRNTKAKRRVEKVGIDPAGKYLHHCRNEAGNVPIYQEPDQVSDGLARNKNVVSEDTEEKRHLAQVKSENLDHRRAHRVKLSRKDKARNKNVCAGRAQGVMKPLKGKNVVREDTEDKKPLVQVRTENLECKRAHRVKLGRKDKMDRMGKLGQAGSGVSLPQKIKDDNVKARSSRKRMYDDINCNENRFEDEEMDTDLEILDDVGVHKNLSSFVPSLRFHKSMEEDASFGHVGSSSLHDGFRKQVTDALRKPFHKEELKMLRKAVVDGSYYFHYPDLKRKVKRSRYKPGKCLNILRGFFFWIQNVTQEGSFKPWKDGQCLAIEPGSTEKSPHSHLAKQPICKKK